MRKTIVEVVESYNVKLWPIGENILRGACPLHVNVNSASFTVYTATDSWFCFGEGIGGDTTNFVSKMEGISYQEAKKLVDGEISLKEDITQMLDSVAVVEEVDYADQLNFSVSKYCRDLMFQYPERVDNILKFLQRLDNEVLTKIVSRDILMSVIAESRRLGQ